VVADHAGARRQWRGLAGAIALATLAACAQRPLPPPLDATPAPDATPAQASEPSQPEEQQQVETADNSPAARAARLAARPPLPGERGGPPARLIGLSREHLISVLGPAGFVRRDGPVQIWRYSNEECFLDVFLYREGDGFRVHHVESRPKGAERIEIGDCYSRLVAERGSG
jgi:hypothetical protein